ncbi:S-adenosylmethionine:diacylglycerol 3-amino-3-carboxypropyl transferase [Kitasatospora sp. SolWspMP-SS2h]|uniref:DUF3419 family protein n=1 Tax=Kitasatospora sp. SolWspMP-SS2h TaxID=1305729 RepID=UPI000DC01CB6|nr:DUF3419 family protein [Kitasatospora sp. SolWspMP-SS2h]RAJ45348.1 S-adenosylmethionine:diacylglycerol 3-amino-3-carboxypropyl transferase [Kitasatospora sp. SolWspMP-SS2h]
MVTVPAVSSAVGRPGAVLRPPVPVAAGTPWQAGRLFAGPVGRPRVLFGRMYEDPAVELAVFPPPGARVLCIASAGDTAAALAAAGYEVTAIDLNPAQLAYARARLEAGAPAVTGTAERLTGLGRATAAALLPAWRSASVADFLRLDDPGQQRRRWAAEFDGPGLRLLAAAALRPAGALAAVLRPGFRCALPRGFDTVLLRRIARTVARHPNAANDWAWRLLLGRERPGAAGPVPASALAPAAATAGGGRVRLVRGEVVEHLERSAAGSYDAVTLSNVVDGPGPRFARRLRAAVEHAVRPGGTAVVRSLREPGPGGPGLAAEDRSMIWGVVRVVRTGTDGTETDGAETR